MSLEKWWEATQCASWAGEWRMAPPTGWLAIPGTLTGVTMVSGCSLPAKHRVLRART